MSLEKIKIVTEIIQNLFVVAGVIVGGLWTLIIFTAKKESQLAKIDYEKKKKELLEFRKIAIACAPKYYKHENSWNIVLEAAFQNIGNGVEIIYWEENNFKVCRTWIDDSGNLCRENYRGFRLENFPGQELGIRLSSEIKINKNFICKVDKPGLYYLEIEVAASQKEQESAKSDGVKSEEYVSWKDVTHIFIPNESVGAD